MTDVKRTEAERSGYVVPEEAAKKQPEDPWIHRASRMRCNTCMYYVTKQRESPSTGPEIGRCRRRSPTLNGYPVVFPYDWCGDHKLDETK